MPDIEEIINQLYQIKIGVPDGQRSSVDTVINKKLRNVLYSDIHEQPLGCKIANTHIKIGNIHLDTFFEAQILFSHAYWVDYFAGWIIHTIDSIVQSRPVLIIGYESYIEPVLYSIKSNRLSSVYGVFEEKKFIQNRGLVLSSERVRYFEDLNKSELLEQNYAVFFLCGISSTLHTFSKMQQYISDCLYKETGSSEVSDYVKQNSFFLSLIQVLPNEFTPEIKNIIEVVDEKTVTSKQNMIENVRYLVDVTCNWHIASDCLLCFPDTSFSDERPIIQTSETSVVPVQMIERSKPEKSSDNTGGTNKSTGSGKSPVCKIDLFSKEKEQYLFSDYLYYDHIDRMDHHFKYYVRTGHLLKDILDDRFPSIASAPDDSNSFFKIFLNACARIKKKLEHDAASTQKQFVDIIVSPAHFSNKVFPNAINQYVFDQKAHTISFDTNKEFRSNFEIKYSNYSYFLEQIKFSKNCDIRFHYVDDQLISGESFYRAKSLITSLMFSSSSIEKEHIHIFNDVIVFLSRHSDSSKLNFVDDLDMYFSFIDLAIPSIRNYGDSCPICKERYDALSYSEKSTLNENARYWHNKYQQLEPKSITQVKENSHSSRKFFDKESNFLRFDCENRLWLACQRCASQEEYTQAILNSFLNISPGQKPRRSKSVTADTLITYIEAISQPFLYYKENEKKAVLHLLLELMELCLSPNAGDKTLKVNAVNDQFTILFDQEKTSRYHLISSLICSLSDINSNYILNVQHIEKILEAIKNSFPNKLDSIKNQIQFAVKRIVCGIGGTEKILHFDRDLQPVIQNINVSEPDDNTSFFLTLFFENSNGNDLSSLDEMFPTGDTAISISTIDKYCGSNHEGSILNTVLKAVSKQDNIISMNFFYTEGSNYHYSFDGSGFPEEILTLDSDWCIRDNIFLYKITNVNDSSDIHQMFLRITFSKEKISDINDYRIIRKIIAYRSKLMEIIYQDTSTDAIRTAIQAKEAKAVVLVDNHSSHGSNQSIEHIVSIIENLINSQDEDLYKRQSCSLLNLLINQCISVANYITFLKSNYDSMLSENDRLSTEAETHTPFGLKLALLDNSGLGDGYTEKIMTMEAASKKFLRTYFSIIADVNSQDSPFHDRETKIQFVIANKASKSNVSKDQFVDVIIDQKYLPSFISWSTSENLVIDFLCIIQAFLKNIVLHSGCKTLDVTFELTITDDGYTLSIINNYDKTNFSDCGDSNSKIANSGLTKKFFEDYFSSLTDGKDNAPFYIQMRDGKPEKHVDCQYISSITVKKRKKSRRHMNEP